MYLLTAYGMRQCEKHMMAKGISAETMMERAAMGLRKEIRKRFTDRGTRLLFLAGGGNNGGDAIAAARFLLEDGYAVTILVTGSRGKFSEEFRKQYKKLRSEFPRHKLHFLDDASSKEIPERNYDVIVDAMFGTGLSRPIREKQADLLRTVNQKKAYRIAVDVPSGLDASTGRILGEAFHADLTVTFGSPKVGCYLGEGRTVSGEVVCVSLGFDAEVYRKAEDRILLADLDFFRATKAKSLPPRPAVSHKGTFGKVGIIISPQAMLGASMLAAKAAYRSGCGLVRVFCPKEYVGYFNVAVPEAVVVPYGEERAGSLLLKFLRTVDAVCIGPGLSEDRMGLIFLRNVLESNTPAVLDAGALHLLAEHLNLLKHRSCPCVLTPHLKEMAALCHTDVRTMSEDRLQLVSQFAKEYHVSLVCKSDTSLIALPRERDVKLTLSTLGNSGLATAGAGDVLTGIITSLMAQGANLTNALLYGVLLHGRAGEVGAPDEDAQRRMMASDIIDNLFLSC